MWLKISPSLPVNSSSKQDQAESEESAKNITEGGTKLFCMFVAFKLKLHYFSLNITLKLDVSCCSFGQCHDGTANQEACHNFKVGFVCHWFTPVNQHSLVMKYTLYSKCSVMFAFIKIENVA